MVETAVVEEGGVDVAVAESEDIFDDYVMVRFRV